MFTLETLCFLGLDGQYTRTAAVVTLRDGRVLRASFPMRDDAVLWAKAQIAMENARLGAVS